MPFWPWWFVPAFVLLALFSFVASPPEAVTRWFLARYRLHPELNEATTRVSVDGIAFPANEQRLFIQDFNNAVFIERYDEKWPKRVGTPVVIETRRGKGRARYFVYSYHDHVDVFREVRNKVVAYRVLSEPLQKHSRYSSVS